MSEVTKTNDDLLLRYRAATDPLPETYNLWPLYGAGFENLGDNGGMKRVDTPEPGPDELLVRHDAVGICFSDIKVLKTGQNHPRIHSDMRTKPVVLGHEVAMTVVKVGDNLKDQYKPGDRFIIQADIYIKGVPYAYGYEVPGGFQQFNIIDWRVLNGDHGNYLIPVQPETGYAEAALNEPWACVVAAYLVDYRHTWKPGGSVWIVGDGRDIILGKCAEWMPASIALSVNNKTFEANVRAWAEEKGIEVLSNDPSRQYDDIVVLGSDPDLIERAFKRLAKGGTFNVVTSHDVERTCQLDIGRIHYDNLAVCGTPTNDISAGYAPIRAQLKAGGTMLAVGAGGPMGQMHMQRALEVADKPARIVASERNPKRLDVLTEKFADEADRHGVEFIPFAFGDFPTVEMVNQALFHLTDGRGYDDIVVLAPTAAAAEAAMPLLAYGGIMVIFAGLPRGTMAEFDINQIVQRGVRFTGTSGSSIEDLRAVLNLVEKHELATNRSVAAIAGLEGLADGLHAVHDGKVAGKIVIYPQISGLPLTPLEELKGRLPGVAAKLAANGSWTNAAEEELLKEFLA